jgi:hypothetical protein
MKVNYFSFFLSRQGPKLWGYCLGIILMMSHLFSAVNSTTGKLSFDANSDFSQNMILNQQGLGIGTTPSSNLHVLGNAIIQEKLLIGPSTSSSNLHLSGTLGLTTQIYSATHNESVIGNCSVVLIDSSSGNVGLYLPYAANVTGRIYHIKKISSSNDVWISGGGNTIDGEQAFTLSSSQMGSAMVLSDGSQWHIMDAKGQEVSVASGNLIAHWPLDAHSSNLIVEKVNGTAQATMTQLSFVDGISNQGVYFDGVNSISLSQDTRISPGAGNFSFTSWIKHESNTGWNRILSGTNIWDEFRFGVRNINKLSLFLQWKGSPTNDYKLSTSSLSTNWNHVAACFDRAANTYYLYINGALKGSGAWVIDDNVDINGLTLVIGEGLKGSLDDLRYYNKALSHAEIQRAFRQSGGNISF